MQNQNPSDAQPEHRAQYQDTSSHHDALRNLIRRGRIQFRAGDSSSRESFLAYGRDRVKKFEPRFDVLVQPADTQETAQLVQYAYEHGLAMVPSGGRTGLAGGALARAGEIVVSLDRMTRVLDFDAYLPALNVEAGMLTADVQKEARERGSYFPVDFASSGSSTIGGNIATNAGGIHVIKYGMTREWTLGLTLVTGTGEVLRMNGPLLKNNTGPDLRHLVVGSEGILGFITEAVLRLTSPPGESEIHLAAVGEFAAVPRVLRMARDAGLDLSVFEYFDGTCLAVTREHLGLPAPFREEHEHHVLMEFARPESPERVEKFLTALAGDESFRDALRAESSRARAVFRSYREGISESLSMGRLTHKNDVSLPIAELDAFMTKLRRILEEDGRNIQAVFFGHIGDGNLHVNLLQPPNMSAEHFHNAGEELDHRVYGLLREMGGSISAEHGIGILKKDYLEYTRTPGEIRLLKDIKQLFDPRGIMNPGKVI